MWVRWLRGEVDFEPSMYLLDSNRKDKDRLGAMMRGARPQEKTADLYIYIEWRVREVALLDECGERHL